MGQKKACKNSGALAIGCRLGGSWANPKNHYILGRSNYLFGADYIEEKNLSQKYGDLRFIEIILPIKNYGNFPDMLW